MCPCTGAPIEPLDPAPADGTQGGGRLGRVVYATLLVAVAVNLCTSLLLVQF